MSSCRMENAEKIKDVCTNTIEKAQNNRMENSRKNNGKMQKKKLRMCVERAWRRHKKENRKLNSKDKKTMG